MRPDVERDWEWSKAYEYQVGEILTQSLSSRILRFITSPHQVDTKEATDMLPFAESQQGAVALRIRRPQYSYRDLTIRAWRKSGAKTEIQKIIEGWGRYYFYGWVKDAEVANWIIADLDRIRESGLLSYRKLKKNNDEATGFVKISIPELIQSEALIAEQLGVDLDHRICVGCRKKTPMKYLSWRGRGYMCVGCDMREQAQEDRRRWLEKKGRQQ